MFEEEARGSTSYDAYDVEAKKAEKAKAGTAEEMHSRIVQGKLDAFLNEKVLLEQPFVKNSDKTIRGLLDEATQKFGERIEIAEFKRLAV